MQKKRLKGGLFLEKLHRGAVYTCIGVTVGGTILLCVEAYRYFTIIKPEREKAALKVITQGSQDSADELKY